MEHVATKQRLARTVGQRLQANDTGQRIRQRRSLGCGPLLSPSAGQAPAVDVVKAAMSGQAESALPPWPRTTLVRGVDHVARDRQACFSEPWRMECAQGDRRQLR